MVDESNTYRSYVICKTCGNKSYAVTGATETYYCSYCEMKFTSDEEPKEDRGKRTEDTTKRKPLYAKRRKPEKIIEEEPKKEDLDEIEEEQTPLEKGIENMAKSSKVAICKGCKEEKTIIAKGLCGACYAAQRREDSGDKKNKRKVDRHKEGLCIGCKAIRRLVAKSMCSACYSKDNKEDKPSTNQTVETNGDCSGICEWSGHCILEQRGLPSAICSSKKIIKGKT